MFPQLCGIKLYDMKTSYLNTILFFLLIICLGTSCTVQKRRYSNGYHIDWVGDINNPLKKKKESKQEPITKTVRVESSKNDIALIEYSKNSEGLVDLDSFKKTYALTQFEPIASPKSTLRPNENDAYYAKGVLKKVMDIQQVAFGQFPILRSIRNVAVPKEKVSHSNGDNKNYGTKSILFLVTAIGLVIVGGIILISELYILGLATWVLAIVLIVMSFINGIKAIGAEESNLDMIFGIFSVAVISLVIILSIASLF